MLAGVEDVPALADFIAQRQRLGQDRLDEVWEGVYVVVPAPAFRHLEAQARALEVLRGWARTWVQSLTALQDPNIGEPDDFREPDVAVVPVPSDPSTVFLPTAILVVEILSPHERSMAKVDFYRARGVEHYIEIDLDARLMRELQLNAPTSGRALSALAVEELQSAVFPH